MDFAVLHVDIDAFFAAVEQVRDPRLAGRPVAVGNGVVASCSYEARRFGLSAGMPLTEARRRCPELVVLDGYYPTYRSFAERVYDEVRRVTPCLDTHLDECYGDLAGTERLHGDLATRAERLRQAVRDATGLAVTVGLGPNRMLAKMAGKTAKPDGLGCVRAADAERFLAGRPAGDLPGIGPAHRRLLESLNVRTVDDLRQLSGEVLAALFGRLGPAFYERARGRDTRAVTAREVPLSISRETAFSAPTTDPDEIGGTVSYLLGRACRAARRLGVAARRVAVRLRYEDGVAAAGAATLGAPSALEADLQPRADQLLARLDTRRVRLALVGVALSLLAPPAGAQLDLLEGPDDGLKERLAGGLDGVRDRFGDGVVVSGRSLHLLKHLPRDRHGFVLRTPSLTK
jgi:DNA polymerase-4